MSDSNQNAPGWPGIAPRWTSSAKSGVGTSLGSTSQVWFTVSHGIFDEIYYPRIDQACVRDMGLLIAGGTDFFSEEKRDCHYQIAHLEEGVPGYHLVNTCNQGRFRIEKEALSDPRRETVLQQTKFVPLKGTLADYRLYVLLAPHLGNRGAGNTGWIGDYKGVPMLFARRDSICLALASSVPWKKRSAGFSGVSDGWHDISQHKEMRWTYDRAENGNVALTGEIDLAAGHGSFLLALGFGRTPAEAGHRARASLIDGLGAARTHYLEFWREWQKTLLPLDGVHVAKRDLYRTSTAVLRLHEAKHASGGSIASLSIPWGFAKGDDDLGGYHLVWPRDMVETAGGLLAAGALRDAHRMLRFLEVTQEADGHWPQNMWLDGKPYWDGVQMDETAFPILLVDLAKREGALGADEGRHYWPMVRKAASFILRNGPITQEDRWEEDPGYSPFTLAAEIAALLAAADLAEDNGEPKVATFLRSVADAWYTHIDDWIYAKGTPLAKECGVEGYYVRVGATDAGDAPSPAYGFVPIRNRPPDQSNAPAAEIVSPDALALVRFGLRAADDPRMLDTVKVLDKLLKVETPSGPCWYRYTRDGYGEHEDGRPFDGTGVGRLWPLLTGERAHYELAAGRQEEALRLLHTLEAFANDGKMLPEQVWDTKDIPERELFFGRPTGSAMPLVWAHGEYIKLRRSLRDGRVFDLPPQTVQRYLVDKVTADFDVWSFNHKRRWLKAGRGLRLKVLAPAVVHWSSDDGKTFSDVPTTDTTLGVHFAELPTQHLKSGDTVQFTFTWTGVGKREPQMFVVTVR
jgi:glucoamylase